MKYRVIPTKQEPGYYTPFLFYVVPMDSEKIFGAFYTFESAALVSMLLNTLDGGQQ